MAKGQWFILSAVIASAAFLSISMMYRGYMSVDTSEVARVQEDFFFLNIMRELNRTFSYSGSDSELISNFGDFSDFAKQKAIEYGYSLQISNTTALRKTGSSLSVNLSTYRIKISKVVTFP